MQKIKKHLTMKELPVTERPYEKCEKNGAGTLSDAELLAIILKTGDGFGCTTAEFESILSGP